jgi:hypothetical protein
MERKPVNSSIIKSAGHDIANNVLELEFSNGKIYRYANVPAEKYAALLAAESIGKHFGTHIKPHHDLIAAESAG